MMTLQFSISDFIYFYAIGYDLKWFATYKQYYKIQKQWWSKLNQ